MKKLSATLVLILVVTFAYSQEVSPPLGLKFGMTKESFMDQMKSQKGKKISDYHENTTGLTYVIYDDIEFGSRTANKLKASFYKNQLAVVQLTFYNAKGNEFFISTFKEKYGEPVEGLSEQRLFYWYSANRRKAIMLSTLKKEMSTDILIDYKDYQLEEEAERNMRSQDKSKF